MYTNCKGEQQIDYIIRANIVPIWFFILAAAVVIITKLLTKKWAVGLLIGYVLIILGETVVFRAPRPYSSYQLQLFWSYKVWHIQKEQILANILVYIPLGLIEGRLWRWKGILIGIGISVASELLQLVTHRGLFEFDDIIHNTLGTLIGVTTYMIIDKVIKKVNNNELQE